MTLFQTILRNSCRKFQLKVSLFLSCLIILSALASCTTTGKDAAKSRLQQDLQGESFSFSGASQSQGSAAFKPPFATADMKTSKQQALDSRVKLDMETPASQTCLKRAGGVKDSEYFKCLSGNQNAKAAQKDEIRNQFSSRKDSEPELEAFGAGALAGTAVADSGAYASYQKPSTESKRSAIALFGVYARCPTGLPEMDYRDCTEETYAMKLCEANAASRLTKMEFEDVRDCYNIVKLQYPDGKTRGVAEDIGYVDDDGYVNPATFNGEIPYTKEEIERKRKVAINQCLFVRNNERKMEEAKMRRTCAGNRSEDIYVENQEARDLEREYKLTSKDKASRVSSETENLASEPIISPTQVVDLKIKKKKSLQPRKPTRLPKPAALPAAKPGLQSAATPPNANAQRNVIKDVFGDN